MARLWKALLLGLALVAFACGGARATITVIEPVDIGLGTERNALVIGNAAYENVTVLRNTLNDARALSDALKDVGFRVYLAEDVGRREMLEAIETFLRAVTPGSEAMIYYSGHGVELDGQNFLLPVDIQDLDPSKTYSLVSDAIGLSQLLAQLESRSARVNLVILDACRNNPFTPAGTRSLGSKAGLSRVEPPRGTIVLYSAAIGETALDRLSDDDPDPNGVFTRHLVDLIGTPGLEIRSMVQDLRVQVHDLALKSANHSQVPSYYDSMIGDFYFRPGAAPVEETAATPGLDPCDMVDSRATLDELLFADPAALVSACQRAVRQNPDEDRYRVALVIAREQLAAQKAASGSDRVLIEAYLRLYPEGRYADDVTARLAALPEPQPVVIEEIPEPEPVIEPAPESEPVEAAPEPEPEPVVEKEGKPARTAAIDPEELEPDPDEGLDRISRQAIDRCEEFVGDRHTPEAARVRLPAIADLDFRVTLPACRRAVAVRPDAPELRFRLAMALTWSGQPTEGKGMVRDLAASGYAPAQYELGLAYLNGGQGVRKNRDTAFTYFEAAARSGYLAAMGMLGDTEAPVDPGAALEWLKQAAAGGHAPSLFLLGTSYGNGKYDHYRGARTIAADQKLAFDLLSHAYEGGEPRAILPLVLRYDSGIGVARSIPQATRLFLAYVAAFPFSDIDLTGRELSSTLRSSVQRELRSLGFYEGIEDGIFGPAVREALGRYNTARFKG